MTGVQTWPGLIQRGHTRSMGRVGQYGDNAAMESFFALLQRKSSTGNTGSPAPNYA